MESEIAWSVKSFLTWNKPINEGGYLLLALVSCFLGKADTTGKEDEGSSRTHTVCGSCRHGQFTMHPLEQREILATRLRKAASLRLLVE